MSDDHDLRSRLERIASTAGDPPEHGFERVAARRHRRLRRRRGAVATAAVLAVLIAGTSLVSQGFDQRERVTASETASPAGAPVEVPRVVDVRCEPAGIAVPVASVRAQRDGLHIRVHNLLPEATKLVVAGGGWSSGDIEVAPGTREVLQPVPPGELTVGCDIAGDMQRRQVNLVDPAGYYQEPALNCDEADIETLSDVQVDPPRANLIAAARAGLDAHLVGGTADDAIGAPRGYEAQRLSVATDDPTVQVERDGAVVAFAHVRGADGTVAAPWTTIVEAQVCASALSTTEVTGTTEAPGTTASTERPGSRPDQPA